MEYLQGFSWMFWSLIELVDGMLKGWTGEVMDVWGFSARR